MKKGRGLRPRPFSFRLLSPPGSPSSSLLQDGRPDDNVSSPLLSRSAPHRTQWWRSKVVLRIAQRAKQRKAFN
jgi:hypothetical protein